MTALHQRYSVIVQEKGLAMFVCLWVICDDDTETRGVQENEQTSLTLVSQEIKVSVLCLERDVHCVDGQDVLALVFENYYLLNDASEFGISETGSSAPEKMTSPPPALVPALSLLGTAPSTLPAHAKQISLSVKTNWKTRRSRRTKNGSLTDSELLQPESTIDFSVQWEKVIHLSTKRWRGLVDMVAAREGDNAHALNSAQMYKGMESLTLSLKQEIEYDISIQSSGFLPHYIHLPSLSASVFCKVLLTSLLRF